MDICCTVEDNHAITHRSREAKQSGRLKEGTRIPLERSNRIDFVGGLVAGGVGNRRDQMVGE